jgi:hypothetical protein
LGEHGISVTGGAEIAAHLVYSMVEAHGEDTSYMLRIFDFTNALNEIFRQTSLDIVPENYTELCTHVLCPGIAPTVE